MVVGGPRVQSFGELLSFSRWARAMDEVPGGRVVAIRRRPAKPAEAERLALPAGTQVYVSALPTRPAKEPIEAATRLRAAGFARVEDGDASELRVVLGIRSWF